MNVPVLFKIGINAPPDVTILRKELLKILSGEVEVEEEAAPPQE
jgi:sRNA-binding carbon storage regulator CsrA